MILCLKIWFSSSYMKVEGKENECMPMGANDGIPITAYRYHSLAGHMTDDDMFSSDLSEEQFQSRLSHVQVPTLLVYSESDQYVPSYVNKKVY